MMMNSNVNRPERLYYLDWLRVFAFSILLFEHSAEVFVDWKYWIKNEETSVFLTQFIAFFLPWRMPLLFIISGAAVTLSFKRKSAMSYFSERCVRLLVPLAFALILIIPPQIYFIKLYRGSEEAWGDFFHSIINLDWHWSPKGNVHFMHLWYLAFLFIYCMLLLPVLQFAKSDTGKYIIEKMSAVLSNPILLLSMGVFINLPYFILKAILPMTYYVSTFTYYFPFFVCGLVFWPNASFRYGIRKCTGKALLGGVALTAGLYWFSITNSDPHTYFLNLSNPGNLPLFIVKSLNQWLWVLGIFGLAMRALNYGSEKLTYATQAVYPFYILHQTVIIIASYFVIRMEAGISYKLALITFLSFGFIYALYELIIKRTNFTRVLFGVKPEAKQIQPSPQVENIFKTPVMEQKAAV